MEWHQFAIVADGKFPGIEGHFWKIIGWLANLIFASRFLVQWYATERRGQVTVPLTFWWLSLVGSFLMLAYALFYNRDLVFIFSNAFNWIPYLRNVMIHRQHASAHRDCGQCGASCPPVANYCAQCGAKLPSLPGANRTD